MNSDSLQQQVALAVAVAGGGNAGGGTCQLHDELPFLTVWTPSQSVFHVTARQKEWVVARLHQDANVPECPKLNVNCLSLRILFRQRLTQGLCKL